MLEEIKTHCPYCGEMIHLAVDGTHIGHQYIEDCFVCCRPIVVSVHGEWGDLSVVVACEDESMF